MKPCLIVQFKMMPFTKQTSTKMTRCTKGGRGVVNHFGLEGEVDIEVGSLSKAFSVMGGFIAAKQPSVQNPSFAATRSHYFVIILSLVCQSYV